MVGLRQSGSLSHRRAMSPEETQQLERLCQAVIHEQDPAKLTKLVAELNELLERKERKENGSTCKKSLDIRIA